MKRVEVESHPDVTAYAEFIASNSQYHSCDLSSKLQNHFNRITLVNKAMTERLTIDTALSFHNVTTGCDYSLEKPRNH